MKAVIVEFRDKYAAALADDSRIIKVKNKNYAVGQIIEIKKTRIDKKIAAWSASAAAVLMLCTTSTLAYFTPYSYVGLDVNPSIEYSLNRFERVLSVKAVNSDGEKILKEIGADNLRHKDIKEAVDKTVKQITDDGYLKAENGGGIIISTSGKNETKAENLAQKLRDGIKTETKNHSEETDIEAVSVGEERVKEADELGVTPGKLNLVQNLEESAPDSQSIDREQWLKKPVKEIMDAIKENKKETKPEVKPAKDKTDEAAVSADKNKGNSKQSSSKSKKNNSNSKKDVNKTDASLNKGQSQKDNPGKGKSN
ncbi:MAG: hypothetical protein Q8865_02470 [Bacillota bacterium]|nr:hypothetical protein [Bacillota bacterium]